MSISYQSPYGKVSIPGAYSAFTVISSAVGLGVSGVIALMGEADSGPDFTLESDLEETCLFGPTQLADVKAKYVSGNLVDAYKNVIAPADDSEIPGAPTAILMVKTNPGVRASATLLDANAVAYGTLSDKNYGKLGNLISYKITESSEVIPTTSNFTYIPSVGTVNFSFRANGSTFTTVAMTANMTPPALVTAVQSVPGVTATGGINRALIGSVTGTVALAAPSGNTAVVTRSVNWSANPAIGDTFIIPSGSVLAGAGNANVGAYVVTGFTVATLTATKLSDAGKGGAVIGVITAPVAVSAASVVSTTADLDAYTPITFTMAAATIINGIGKTLEINSLTTGTDLLSRTAFVLGTATPVTWISVSGAPTILKSATERSVKIAISRQLDNVSESISAGGTNILEIGYSGTSCAVTVSSTGIGFTAVGGLGSSMTLAFKDYPTINDLATYIGAQVGYKARAVNNTLGQMNPAALDEGTYAAGTTYGNYALRLKADAADFFDEILTSSIVTMFYNGTVGLPAASGLPGVTTGTLYLAGGLKGATTDAVIANALSALEKNDCNFVVPLYSQDATADIALAATESGSTYTIAAINANTLTHCLQMSTYKRKKEREAMLSFRGTYLDSKSAAGNASSGTACMTFADAKGISATTGSIVQFQPWMAATYVAGMQAAGFYKSTFEKDINSPGFVYAAGDFDPKDDDQVEDAMDAGLMVFRKSKATKKWQLVKDQTTYQKDDNFVFNSLQATYALNLVSDSTRTTMQAQYVSKILSEFDAPMALSTLESIMANLMRLKLIGPSEDAPKGFKNASIKISGRVMAVSLEVKLATALYFVDIAFSVSQISSSASQ